jgi:CRISPR-associated protein Cmr6
MRRPLYQTKHAPRWEPAQGNFGLWYTKYFDRWSTAWTLKSQGDASPKAEWINDNRPGKDRSGSPALFREYNDRLLALVHARGGTHRVYRTVTRLVPGTGNPHPIEVGLTWHPIRALPYVPASSLKGVVRDWAQQWACANADEVQRIFGPDGSDARAVGSIIFYDMLPWEPVALDPDVMTPHHPAYYRGAEPVPGDWESPVPVPFLTVAPDQLYGVAVAPRNQDAGADLPMVQQWIDDALNWLGVGAKTAAGYGRLMPKGDWSKPVTLVEPVPSSVPLTPIEQEMKADGYAGESFMQALTTKWLARMEQATDPAEAGEIARLLARWYQTHRPADWAKPKGKNVSKVETIQRWLSDANPGEGS